MTMPKTAYQLSESQVTTPARVVALFWSLARERRPNLGKVLDMGAGDCRFAHGGTYRSYTGVEIDRRRSIDAVVPRNGRLITGCAFRHRDTGYDACIGNPPYVRHHDIEPGWKEETVARIERELGLDLDRHCNLYLYFLCLGLIKTHDRGFLALVVPYEWVSRPSAKAIRQYIRQRHWDVDVYRFRMPIFPEVLTTASVSIVDKAGPTGRWSFYDVLPSHKVVPRAGVVDNPRGVLEYTEPGPIRAMRGLSPGSQAIFTLTEGERVHAGLSRGDVCPCVTTLRNVPRELRALTCESFRKHFVEAGQRCWLIKSHEDRRSDALNAYLKSIPAERRNTYTCHHQSPWFKYLPHPVSRLLVSSGFTEFGPKVLVNSVGAIAVGSVFGIHGSRMLPLRRLQEYLLGVDFEKQLVAHAKTLKKIEVKQFNAVLNAFTKEAC